MVKILTIYILILGFLSFCFLSYTLWVKINSVTTCKQCLLLSVTVHTLDLHFPSICSFCYDCIENIFASQFCILDQKLDFIYFCRSCYLSFLGHSQSSFHCLQPQSHVYLSPCIVLCI